MRKKRLNVNEKERQKGKEQKEKWIKRQQV
jgi:hypothetical protein